MQYSHMLTKQSIKMLYKEMQRDNAVPKLRPCNRIKETKFTLLLLNSFLKWWQLLFSPENSMLLYVLCLRHSILINKKLGVVIRHTLLTNQS